MKFYERLENLAFKLRSKALYYELKYYVERKTPHIRTFHRWDGRGIGKTYSLMKISGKYRIPVLEPVGIARQYLPRVYKKFNPIVINSEKLRMGYRPGAIVLVDERQLLNNRAKEILKDYIQSGFEVENN